VNSGWRRSIRSLLMGRAHPLRSDQEELTRELVAAAPGASEAPPIQDRPARIGPVELPAPARAPRDVRALVPRLMVVLALVVAGIVWAAIRGLHFYGLAPLHLAYGLDQPPLLLILVGGWLAYRSSRR
jgi:hypothetical protein